MKTAAEWIQERTMMAKKNVVTKRFLEADILEIQMDALDSVGGLGKMIPSKEPRRERCQILGIQCSDLTPEQAAVAWRGLSISLQHLWEKDIPKFADLFSAIETAAIAATREL